MDGGRNYTISNNIYRLSDFLIPEKCRYEPFNILKGIAIAICGSKVAILICRPHHRFSGIKKKGLKSVNIVFKLYVYRQLMMIQKSDDMGHSTS